MAKSAYIGIDGKARKLKKCYVGVEGKARKLKKAYVGVANVARPFWSSGVAYYGKITTLSQARYGMIGATVGDYGLFAGGAIAGGGSPVVDAYSPALVRTIPTALTTAGNGQAAENGSYAVIMINFNNAVYANAYNTLLTKYVPATLSEPRANLGAARAGNYAVFAGGQIPGGSNVSASVETYSANLTRASATGLSVARSVPRGISIGGNALFAGGLSISAGFTTYATVDAYNSALARSLPAALSSVATGPAGAATDTHAIYTVGPPPIKINAYDANLVRVTAQQTWTAQAGAAGVSAGGYALFATDSGVHVYDSSLLPVTLPLLELSGRDLGSISSTAAGSYALYGGGAVMSGGAPKCYATVDAYVA